MYHNRRETSQSTENPASAHIITALSAERTQTSVLSGDMNCVPIPE